MGSAWLSVLDRQFTGGFILGAVVIRLAIDLLNTHGTDPFPLMQQCNVHTMNSMKISDILPMTEHCSLGRAWLLWKVSNFQNTLGKLPLGIPWKDALAVVTYAFGILAVWAADFADTARPVWRRAAPSSDRSDRRFGVNDALILAAAVEPISLIDRDAQILMGLMLLGMSAFKKSYWTVGAFFWSLAVHYEWHALYFALPLLGFTLGQVVYTGFRLGTFLKLAMGDILCLVALYGPLLYDSGLNPFEQPEQAWSAVVKPALTHTFYDPIAVFSSKDLLNPAHPGFWSFTGLLVPWDYILGETGLYYISIGFTIVVILGLATRLVLKPVYSHLLVGMVFCAFTWVCLGPYGSVQDLDLITFALLLTLPQHPWIGSYAIGLCHFMSFPTHASFGLYGHHALAVYLFCGACALMGVGDDLPPWKYKSMLNNGVAGLALYVAYMTARQQAPMYLKYVVNAFSVLTYLNFIWMPTFYAQRHMELFEDDKEANGKYPGWAQVLEDIRCRTEEGESTASEHKKTEGRTEEGESTVSEHKKTD
eukprot:Clim_evm18s84 gene=Clim_evmTU18s84